MNNSLLDNNDNIILYIYFNNYGEGEVCQKGGLHRDASPLISRCFFSGSGGGELFRIFLVHTLFT